MKSIWEYTADDLTVTIREHLDAVLIADAETNEYRSLIHKGVFEKLIGDSGKYTDLIETLWFHFSETHEKITENYHVFLPSYGRFSGKISKRIRMADAESGNPFIAQMTVYPLAENRYVILLDALDDSEYQREFEASKKVNTIQNSFLFSMFFDLTRDTTSSLNVTEISDETVHAEIPYSGWRNMIVNMFRPEDQGLFLERTDPEYLKKHFAPGETSSFDILMQNMEGKFIWVKLIFSRVETTNEDDYRFVFMVQNIHENSMELFSTLKKYEHQALTDSLTGLYNHGRMETEISNALEGIRKQQRPAILLFADIDYFKNINDQRGHAAGDKALGAFARLITEQIGEKDAIAGRWGGEEFLIVCYDTDAEKARAFAEDLRKAVEKAEFEDAGHFTVSIGVAELKAEDTPETAFNRADKALYQAKEAGRNRVVAAQ